MLTCIISMPRATKVGLFEKTLESLHRVKYSLDQTRSEISYSVTNQSRLVQDNSEHGVE